MTSEYSVSVDDWDEEHWEFIGREIMREYYEKHPKAAEDEGFTVEDGEVKYLNELLDRETPMMLYAYPIYSSEYSYDEAAWNEKVRKVCMNTACTVVMKKDTEEYYLALTGGGMDLSQDIALAYIFIDGLIPAALALNVSRQYGLTKSGRNWFKIMRECKRSLKGAAAAYNSAVKDINGSMKNARERLKEQKEKEKHVT